MSLRYKHISAAVNSSLNYIQGRRDGSIKSLSTSLKKLDNALLAGIEWNKIFTIGGMSGSGKSMLCEQLKRDIVEYNSEPVKILSFEFEMPSYEQVTRNLSGHLSIPVRDLYSAEKALDDDTFYKVVNIGKSLTKYPIYYVDDVGSVEEVINTILAFVKDNEDVAKGETGLVVTIDHVLLTKGGQGQTEREIIASLYRALIGLKKRLISEGLRVLFIPLSQLNREIESIERKANPDYHYPNRNDLFGSNDIFMGSDYVLVIHKPQILNLATYGNKGLPIVNSRTNNALIYFHLLKHRSGEPKILIMEDNFKYSRIVEYDSSN
jgi:replicative DNA helicase